MSGYDIFVGGKLIGNLEATCDTGAVAIPFKLIEPAVIRGLSRISGIKPKFIRVIIKNSTTGGAN